MKGMTYPLFRSATAGNPITLAGLPPMSGRPRVVVEPYVVPAPAVPFATRGWPPSVALRFPLSKSHWAVVWAHNEAAIPSASARAALAVCCMIDFMFLIYCVWLSLPDRKP